MAWEYFAGPFNYNVTPLGPLGFRVITHHKTLTQKSWEFRGLNGWSLGTSHENYRCQNYIACNTLAVRVADTVAIRHHTLTQPEVTDADRLQHGLSSLTNALKGQPYTVHDAQLDAIT